MRGIGLLGGIAEKQLEVAAGCLAGIGHCSASVLLEAVASMCDEGHGRVIRLLCFYMAERRLAIRDLACQCLKDFVRLDAREVAQLVHLCVRSAQELQAARGFLHDVQRRRLSLALGELRALLQHKAAEVRAAAGRLVALLAHGDPETVSSMAGRLEHPQAEMRASAVEILGLVAKEGDQETLVLVVPRLCDSDLHTRDRALETVVTLAGRGDARARQIAMSCVDKPPHEGGFTKVVALKALSAGALPGDAPALTKLAAALEDPDFAVRDAALEAFAALARPGDARATATVLECLAKPQAFSKMGAIRALAVVSSPNNPLVMTHLASVASTATGEVLLEAEKARAAVTAKSQASETVSEGATPRCWQGVETYEL